MKHAKPIKVLVVGCSGMLGSTLLRYFAEMPQIEVHGSVRSEQSLSLLPTGVSTLVSTGIDAENFGEIRRLFKSVHPEIVINCVGVVKQLAAANDPLISIPVNSLFPHRFAALCAETKSRLIHISTDCVFSGLKGSYTELDTPDASDLYGRSKLLGEIDYPHAVTLRTSIIGHELSGTRSLVDWFLSQEDRVSGFSKAIFSGFPTVELAKVITEYVLPNPELTGLYHVSANPISKYELLNIISRVYGKDIEIEVNDTFTIDRSLDSSRFRAETGFRPASWQSMVSAMKTFG